MNNSSKKFNKVLTVILVLVVVAIIILGSFWGYTAYKNNKINSEGANSADQFVENVTKGSICW